MKLETWKVAHASALRDAEKFPHNRSAYLTEARGYEIEIKKIGAAHGRDEQLPGAAASGNDRGAAR